MSSEKIQLPDFVIANLYTDLLVLSPDTQSKRILTNSNAEQTLKTINPVVPASIKKPIAVTTEITKSAAVEIGDVNEAKQWYLGNNGKQIVVLMHETGVAHINDKHLQFLSNILYACKLNLGDIALVNYANNPYDYSELKQKLQPKFVLVFDLETKHIKLPFNIPNYQVQLYDNCKFLFAVSLAKMDGDSQEAKVEKSKLWLSLKNMFQL